MAKSNAELHGEKKKSYLQTFLLIFGTKESPIFLSAQISINVRSFYKKNSRATYLRPIFANESLE